MRSLKRRPRDTAIAIAAITGSTLSIAGMVGGVVERSIVYLLSVCALALVAWLLLKVLAAQDAAMNESRQLWGLAGLFHSGRVFPPPGGAALGPNALNYLAREIASRQPSTLVEIGPGASSVLLHHAITSLRIPVKMYGLEHHKVYHELCKATLRYHSLHDYVLLYAPIETWRTAEGSWDWYASESVGELPESIDVLVVDGPPNPPGENTRYPAYPLLRGRLRHGALIVVDDTHRTAERAMVKQWQREGPLRLTYDGEDFMALEVHAPSGETNIVKST